MNSDPAGLFALDYRLSYHWQDVLPNPNPNVGGVTDASFPLVSCRCTGSGGCWKLDECGSTLLIQMILLNGVADKKESRFYFDSEREHAADFIAAMGEFRRAGENVERQERAMTFSSEAECQARAVASMVRALGPILQRVWNETKLKHDAPRLGGFLPPRHRWTRW